MNTEDMLKELASLLNSFFIHPKFLEELRTLLKTDLKGKESIFLKILTTQLSNIKNFGSAMKYFKVQMDITIPFIYRNLNLMFV